MKKAILSMLNELLAKWMRQREGMAVTKTSTIQAGIENNSRHFQLNECIVALRQLLESAEREIFPLSIFTDTVSTNSTGNAKPITADDLIKASTVLQAAQKDHFKHLVSAPTIFAEEGDTFVDPNGYLIVIGHRMAKKMIESGVLKT